MKIIYTYTDEAPALATGSLLPIVRRSPLLPTSRSKPVTSRWRAHPRPVPDRLTDDQFTSDALTELGELAQTPEANIIKLPNISASVPQLKAAIRSSRHRATRSPDYPDKPPTPTRSATSVRVTTGQGQRREPGPARGQFRPPCTGIGEGLRQEAPAHDGCVVGRLQVARGNHERRRLPLDRAGGHGHAADQRTHRTRGAGRHGQRARSPTSRCLPGRSSTRAVMRAAALDRFLAEQIADAKANGVLFSVHLKATMMKVSDPILFGHTVQAFFPSWRRRSRPGRTPTTDWRATAPDKNCPRQRNAIQPIEPPTPGRAGDGRFGPRYHEPACAQRRDHRRLDAGGDPCLGPDVERAGRAAGHQVRDPRSFLRAALRGDARGLPPARRA